MPRTMTTAYHQAAAGAWRWASGCSLEASEQEQEGRERARAWHAVEMRAHACSASLGQGCDSVHLAQAIGPVSCSLFAAHSAEIDRQMPSTASLVGSCGSLQES
eukprot:1142680-Rhodomonas_salina.1